MDASLEPCIGQKRQPYCRFQIYDWMDRKSNLHRMKDKNNLHSGPDGFEKKLWNGALSEEEQNAVTLSRNQSGW